MKQLRLLCLVFATLLILGASGFAQPSDLHEIGRRRIDELVRWAKSLESSRHAAFDRAQAALTHADGALVMSKKEEDPVAAAVANEALKKDLHNAAKAQLLWDLSRETVRLTEAFAKDWKGSDTFLFAPVNIKGTVLIKTKAGVRPFNGTYVMQTGDTVTTGPDSSVFLRTPEGHLIMVRENSTFTLGRQAGRLESAILSIIKGDVHVERPRVPSPTVRGSNDETLYRAVQFVVATKGTEFEMSVDPDHGGRLVPISGIMEMSAVADAPASALDAAWKLDASQAAYEAPQGTGLARVAAVMGDASITGSGDHSQPAAAGDALAAGQQVQTGVGGFVLLDLTEGQRVVLAPGSRLSAGANAKSGAAYYALKDGRARFWGTGAAVAARILTPNSVTEPRASRYEIGLRDGGAADFSIGGGTITITAVKSKLDQSKLNEWWEP